MRGSGTFGGGPAAGEAGRRADRGIRSALLLPAEDRVLENLDRTDAHDPFGRDLDGLAGLRVTAHTRLPVREHDLADARQDECAALLGLLDGQRLNLID